MPTYQSLWTHWKTFELAALLGLNETYAGAHLVRLWTWAIDNAPDGNLSRLSERAIAHGAGWTQEVGLFVQALRKSGFLDESMQLHDWDEYAGKLIETRAQDAERKRKSRGQATDVQRTSNGASGDVQRRQDKTRQEETRQEETTVTTPQPPPQAEGENPPTPQRGAEGRGAEGRGNGSIQRRRGSAQGHTKGVATATPPLVVAATLTPADLHVWSVALTSARDYLNAANLAMVTSDLEPVGRGADGGLLVRAPPGHAFERFRGTLARSLMDAGDEHAARVLIFEE